MIRDLEEIPSVENSAAHGLSVVISVCKSQHVLPVLGWRKQYPARMLSGNFQKQPYVVRADSANQEGDRR